MASHSITFLENGSASSETKYFPGGRAVLSIIADTYATTTNLVMLSLDGATFIAVNDTNITADGNYSFDCPPGFYALTIAGGSPAGYYASLTSIPYT